MKPQVYTASTLRHARMWKSLRESWAECEFVASWLDSYDQWNGPDIATICRDAWTKIEFDVLKSHYIIVYADRFDKLRGGLVEAGMGIILGKRVITIGEHESYGTWQYHPSVIRVPLLQNAREIINAAR